MFKDLFQKMSQSIIDGDSDTARLYAKQAVEAGIAPLKTIKKGFVVGVIQGYEHICCSNAFLPELVMVGCAPVPRDWVQKIGTDGQSEDAINVATFAKQLVIV